MTLLYRKNNAKKSSFLSNNSKISIIVTDKDDNIKIQNWFKGSRERGLR